jgi:hypothetical protein
MLQGTQAKDQAYLLIITLSEIRMSMILRCGILETPIEDEEAHKNIEVSEDTRLPEAHEEDEVEDSHESSLSSISDFDIESAVLGSRMNQIIYPQDIYSDSELKQE